MIIKKKKQPALSCSRSKEVITIPEVHHPANARDFKKPGILP
jgi:hypothetical protein